jgi:hypothetical protein
MSAAVFTRNQRGMLGAKNHEIPCAGDEESPSAPPGNAVVRSPSDIGAGL